MTIDVHAISASHVATLYLLRDHDILHVGWTGLDGPSGNAALPLTKSILGVKIPPHGMH